MPFIPCQSHSGAKRCWHGICYDPFDISIAFITILTSSGEYANGNDRRRSLADGEGQRSQIRRFPFCRYPRQRAARHRADFRIFDEDKFESGHAFDGSSIAGWKGIEASDMLLMPDPNTANIDPFMEETTLFMQCDVIEPSDGKGYDRDPRSIAKRAEAYLKSRAWATPPSSVRSRNSSSSTRVRWKIDMSGCFVKIELGRSVVVHRRNSKAATAAIVRPSRAATSRCRRSTASRTCVRKCA
jgi:hypothetical protein